jgi:hypothetical protein
VRGRTSIVLATRALAILLCLPPTRASAAPPATCPIACDAGGCTVNEILNVPIGDVEVTITDACELQVDGMSTIDPPQEGAAQITLSTPERDSCFMETILGTPNFSQSIAGSVAEIRQVGVVDGMSGHEIMLTRIANFDGALVQHSVNCDAVQAESYEAHIYSGTIHVVSQNVGPQPPIMVYPKVDLLDMACGILTNGDLYTVFHLGAAQPIEFVGALPPAASPGPFLGDTVFVFALNPAGHSTLQETIENRFSQTGPIRVRSVYAGHVPGVGEPCIGSCAGDLAAGDKAVRRFMDKGARALARCSAAGAPSCPAPCREYPTVGASGVSAGCYDRIGCNLDELFEAAAADSWGTLRCPAEPATECDVAATRAARRLVQRVFSRHRRGTQVKIPGDVQRCVSRIHAQASPACSTAVCDGVPGWVAAILGS